MHETPSSAAASVHRSTTSMTDALLTRMEAIADKLQPIENSSENDNDKEEPDRDSIKMFVGQIPKAWGEKELRKLFEEYGRVHQVTVLRDRIAGTSRGCCFVTFFTRRAALEAQNSLHNVKTLGGLHNPVQMKPAESEKKSDRKLFVGMLNRDYTEDHIRLLFSPYGAIEECAIIRDSKNQSKGCAFVTFVSRQCAINAIKGLNNTQSLQGMRGPLLVKFADTPQEKEQKKRQQMSIYQGYPYNQLNALTTPPLVNQPSNLGCNWLPFGAAGSLNLSALTLQQLLSANAGLANTLTSNSMTSPLLSTPSSVPLNTNVLQNIIGTSSVANNNSFGLQGGNTTTNVSSPTSTGVSFANFNALANINGNTSTGYFAANNLLFQQLQRNGLNDKAQENIATERTAQKVGPEGANLFIYHLPPDFDDGDLVQMFTPFGNVLSAKVFVDFKTNRSKCFGFVSYDDAAAAQKAIQNMNGFQINDKRLKVQLKRSKDKPY